MLAAMHQQIFEHRGWWQELDEHRDKFAALLPRHGIEPTPENVHEVWMSAWVASWPFVELRWVPENHRAEVAKRTTKLAEAMRDAGLEGTAHYGVLLDILNACERETPLGEWSNEFGRHKTASREEPGLLGLEPPRKHRRLFRLSQVAILQCSRRV